MKTAIITVLPVRTGPVLPNFCSRGIKVYDTYRRKSSVNCWRIEDLGIDKHPTVHQVEYGFTTSDRVLTWPRE